MSNSKSLSFSKRLVAGVLSFVTCAAVVCAPASEVLPEMLSSQNLSMSASAAYRSSSITAISGNVTLYAGDYLQNGDYKAILQTDGNFVVYNTRTNQAMWHSGTYYRGKYSNYHLVVQTDGNLVLYARKGNNNDYWLWTSGTNTSNFTCGNGYYFTLSLSNSGRLALTQTYRGMSSTASEKWNNNCTKNKRRIEKLFQGNYGGWLNGGSYSIAAAGCALTSYAMVYNLYNGTSKSPEDLNYSPYISGGNTMWKGVAEKLVYPSYARIAEQVRFNPTIVCIENDTGVDHYVVVYGCTKFSGSISASDLLVADPASASVNTLQDAMNRKGYNPRIYSSRIWTGDSQW